MPFPIELPIKPMLAKLSREIPDGDGWLYEPKWDGFRCVVARDGDDIELTSRSERPFTRYFPELLPALATALPQKAVVDGEIVVPDADGKGLDFDALLQRIHPAASRVNRLAAETPTVYIAFDLLALGDESWLERPLSERRARLLDVVRTQPLGTAQTQSQGTAQTRSQGTAETQRPSVFITPATGDVEVARDWFTTFEGAGLDGVVAKRLDDVYQPDKRALVKVKHQRTADCALAGYRIHKDGQGVGSLLLGLFDEAGVMHHVGVAAAFTASERRQLLAELQPLIENSLDGHPWAEWAEFAVSSGRGADPGPGQAVEAQRRPGATSRWSAGKDLSWVPVRVERVVEVTFGQLENGRFRHGVTFVRWRPDRTPEGCRYDQLDVASPVDFREFMASSSP